MPKGMGMEADAPGNPLTHQPTATDLQRPTHPPYVVISLTRIAELLNFVVGGVGGDGTIQSTSQSIDGPSNTLTHHATPIQPACKADALTRMA